MNFNTIFFIFALFLVGVALVVFAKKIQQWAIEEKQKQGLALDSKGIVLTLIEHPIYLYSIKLCGVGAIIFSFFLLFMAIKGH